MEVWPRRQIFHLNPQACSLSTFVLGMEKNSAQESITMPTFLRNVLLFFLALAPLAHADVPCSPTTPVADQIRTSLKHRTSGLQSVALNTTSVPDMLSWPNPSQISRANSPIDPRENQAFRLSGDLWRIVIEDNDCDFHLELAAPGAGSSADRVIVEIPQGPPFTDLRNRIQQALADAHDGNIGTTGKTLKKSIPVTVSGLAFFDAFHFSRTNPKRGNKHGTKFVGTIWELHPVFDLKIGIAPVSPPTLLAAETVPIAAEPEGGAFDFSLTPAFLRTLESNKSISFTTNLKLGSHSGVHPINGDCEVHLAGFPVTEPFGSPSAFIVEPPNLCHFNTSGAVASDTSDWLTEFDGLKGKSCSVTGFPRIFTEHASNGGEPSNPNHVLEIHPALTIDCGAGQRFDFSPFLTALPGMRAIAPSTTTSCITQRHLFVRFDSTSQQYLFREEGGRCGNFAVVEVVRVFQQSIRTVGTGHSAILRVSPDGQSDTTLKIYTEAGSQIDSWLTKQQSNPTPEERVFIHGLFTYDYFAIQRTLHPLNAAWLQPADWVQVRFPLAFVAYGQTNSAPWSDEQ